MARALFIGGRTPLSAAALAGWLASGNEVAEVWVREPGLGKKRFGVAELTPGWLAKRGLTARTVPRLSRWPEAVEAVAETGADVLITCATDIIVPTAVLELFGPRAVNLHPTLLPAYRGPSPYMPMLLDGRGDADGGVTLHVLTPGIDEGDVIAQQAVPFGPAGGTFTPWYAQLIAATHRLCRDELPRYLRGEIAARPQAEGGAYVRLRPPVLLEPTLRANRAVRMLERAGTTQNLVVAVPGRKRPIRVWTVTGATEVTGAPPLLRQRSVEMDFVGARLKLRRVTSLDRQIERWRLAWALRWLQL